MATTSYTGKGWMTIDLTGAILHAGGEICNVLNPEGEHVIIDQAILYTVTASTGACNINIGIGTTAQHDQTEIANAIDIVALAAGTACNCFANGDAADLLPIWGEDEYLVACGSGDSTGFVGRLHVHYVHV